MKLKKAIEIQEKLVGNAPSWSPVDKVEALQLGIEALKWFKRYQAGWRGLHKPLLPGETEE